MGRIDLPQLGWRRDLPDPRDLTPAHEVVRDLLAGLKRRGSRRDDRASRVDLREFSSPVTEDVAGADAPAAAVTSLVECFERRASGRRLDLAPQFLTHVASRLMPPGGDAPCDLRTTLKALVRFGAPPRSCWPEGSDRRAAENDPFFYGFSRDFASIRYVRLDPSGAAGSLVLKSVRAFLAAGFPCAFGCSLPDAASAEAEIPFPTRFDAMRGGTVLVSLGFDDNRRIRSSKGALLVRGIWGRTWGEEGFGWLPYRYLEDRLAADFWTLARAEWLASGEFTQPAV